VIKNSNPKFHYEFNILSEYISPKNQAKAQKQLAKYRNVSIKFIELKNIDKSKFFLNFYFPVSTYYRFYIPEVFKDYDRILYLDGDLIVDYDISELAEMDFEDKLAICCPSPYIHNIIKNGGTEKFPISYFKETLGIENPAEYFNTGVMAYNLKKINEKNLFSKFFEALEHIKEPKLLDQDILNSVFSQNGGVKLISQKYNNTRGFKITHNRLIINRIKRFFRIMDKDKLFYIYHYVGKNKPWNTKRPDDILFYFYAKKSPFYKEILKENQQKTKKKT
jgi:lipopolysaccharide biosynthesis glycosyltransferase